jgi:phosphohistidine phosphatase SixA
MLIGSAATAALVMALYRGAPETLHQRAREAVGSPPAGRLSPIEAADLVKGGNVILHFRHAQREKWDSVIAFDVYELAAHPDSANASFRNAVCLTPQGIEEARMIGKIFELAKVGIGAVVASPSCRAQQTARLAFGRIDRTSAGLAHTPVTNSRNAAAFGDELERVLRGVPLAPGRATMVVAHANTLENHPELFAQGAELLRPLLLETGFYVITRDDDGALRLRARFESLGDFAAAAIELDPTP